MVFDLNGFTVLARYLTKNNTLDPSYGTDGFSVSVNLQYARAALQSDGKVVVTGLYNVTGDLDWGLARFNTDGSIDTDFGVNGLQVTDFFGDYDWPNALAIQNDGKIVVAGQAFNTGNGTYDFALARYTINGTLDDTFDGDGRQTTDFFNDFDLASALAIQTDGKLVVTGQTKNTDNGNYDFALARYNIDGSLDGAFGVNGKQTTDFFNYGDYAFAIAIQSDGKIVVGGQASDNPNNNDDFALVCYKTDGTQDSTFGVDGKQTTDFFNHGYDRALAIALQSDGKIILAGQVGNNATNNIDFGLVRYSAYGILDATFGTGGKLSTDFFGDQDYALALAIQSDGRIIAIGETYNSASIGADFALARYNTNGTLDNRFDKDGKLTGYYPAGLGYFTAVAIQKDGKIVAAGLAYNNDYNSDFSLARFNTNGTLDKTFNHTGKQSTDFSGRDDYIYAIAIQNDGKIVVAGATAIPDPNDPESYLSDIALARYNTNGVLDSKFGRAGKVSTDFPASIDEAFAMTIQSDGKILVAGRSNIGSNGFDFALVRYNANGTLDGTFGTGGKQTTDFSSSYEGAYALAIQSDGKIVAGGETYTDTKFYDFALARYTANGTLDVSFDGDGRQTTDFGAYYDNIHSIAIQNDKIIAVGSIYDSTSYTYDFGLARYLRSDGSLDGSFGVDGKQSTDFFDDDDDAFAMALQSDNKIIVVGGAYNPTNGSEDFALARYTVDGIPDISFDGDGKQTSAFSDGYDFALALAINDNELYTAGFTRGPIERGVVAAYTLSTIAANSPVITSLPAKEPFTNSTLKVKAMPNPSTSSFTLVLQSANYSSATIRITNAAGQLIETKTNIAANSSLQLGITYTPGIYYAEIVQGSEKTVVKLVKQ